ncbi:MAG: Ig-like domain-containing protein [Patescibacteria group bacterium]
MEDREPVEQKHSAARRRALRRVASFAFVFGVSVLPTFVFAQTLDPGLTGLSENLGLGAGDPRVLIARVIRVLLGFLGIIGVGVVLYAGYLWMTAGGNSDQVDTARQVLRNGLIGLIIIIMAFSIVSFLIGRFLGTGGGGSPGGGPNPPCQNCIALGGGIVEDHYPGRNQKNVPRNTSVFITFREPIFVAPNSDANSEHSFLTDVVSNGQSLDGEPCATTWCGHVNPAVFDLSWDTGTAFESVAPGHAKLKGFTADEKVFGFQLQDGTLFGSPDRNSEHRGTVTSLLRKKDGNTAMLSDYVWTFEVSTIIDTTPPRITNVYPYPTETAAPRNALVLITFDEPVNPISSSGIYDAAGGQFRNITVNNDDGSPLTGQYVTGNGYRTVEFSTFSACGTNSCGRTMYCLPGNAPLSATVKAASLFVPTCAPTDPLNNPSRACSPIAGVGLYDGVVDMADNSLDGNAQVDAAGILVVDDEGRPVFPTGDGKAKGPSADTYSWNFGTSNAIVKNAPLITKVVPEPGAERVAEDAPMTATFNRPLSAVRALRDVDGVTRNPAYIAERNGAVWGMYGGGFWLRQSTLKLCSGSIAACAVNSDCDDADAATVDLCGQEDLTVNHSGFTRAEIEAQKQYEPRLGSVITDVFQNCFTPSSGPGTPPDAYSDVPGEIYSSTP